MSLSLAVVLFSGCSNQEVALANSLANSAVGASGVTSGGSGSFNPHSSLKSPDAVSGMAQSQVIGAQMMMNPGVIGAGAVGTAISEQNKAENRAGYKKVSALMDDPDTTNDHYSTMMVQAYNKQNGTHYRTMQELQDAAKIQGYNKQSGTNFKTFKEVRLDYNKKKGTDFKTDKQFRDWIEEN